MTNMRSLPEKMPARQPGRQRFVQVLAIIFSLALFTALYLYAHTGRSTYDRDGVGITYETARVLDVLSDNTDVDETAENVLRGSQELELEILTGRYAGETANVTNYLSAFYNVYVQPGDKVSVSIKIGRAHV